MASKRYVIDVAEINEARMTEASLVYDTLSRFLVIKDAKKFLRLSVYQDGVKINAPVERSRQLYCSYISFLKDICDYSGTKRI